MARDHGPVIETERLVLRLPGREDAEEVARFYTENRSFLQPWSPRFNDELFSVRAWRERIEGTVAEFRSGRGLRLVILPRAQTSRVIGVANFTSMTRFPSYLCNLGYSLAESEQEKGLMTEALRGAIAYVFGKTSIHRIEANYMPRNLASARVLEKLGFTVEGRAKDYLLIDGKWEEHIRTSLTSSCWKEPPQMC